MIPKDQEKIISLYESRLDQYADSAKTVGWGSREDQFLRFATLCRGLELKGKRVLDIGCGLGDFVSFADQHTGGDYDYVGVDIAEKLISRAKNKFPSDRRTFLCGDFQNIKFNQKFDLVVLSGALSVRITDNINLAHQTLTKMAALAEEAAAANFLSTHVDYQLEKDFHFDPGAILNFAKSLSRWVRIYHDYPLYEFTVQILSAPHKSDRQR